MWSGEPIGKYRKEFLNIMEKDCAEYSLNVRNANAFDAAMILKDYLVFSRVMSENLSIA